MSPEQRSALLPGEQDGDTREFDIECPVGGLRQTKEELLAAPAPVDFVFTLRSGKVTIPFAVRVQDFGVDPTREKYIRIDGATAWEIDDDGNRLNGTTFDCHGWLSFEATTYGTVLGKLNLYIVHGLRRDQ